MTVKITAADAEAALLALTARLDQGTVVGNAVIKIYSGTVPAGPSTALTDQVELISLSMSNPSFGTTVVDQGTYIEVEANTISVFPAVASGTASFFRIFDGDGNTRWQGLVSISGGGGDLEIISGIDIVSGVTVAINSFFASFPKE